MHIKRSISGRIDKGSIGHNNRELIAPNVDKSRTHENITLIREDIQKVYHELFDKALEEYNAKQKRKDRRIKNYYEHINRSKQEKPFYELIFQIGNTEDTHCGTPEAALATKALTDFKDAIRTSGCSMPSYILMRKRLISISTLFRLQPIRSEGYQLEILCRRHLNSRAS